MDRLSQSSKLFIYLMASWLVIGAYFVWTIPKGELVLLVNIHHTDVLDTFNKNITYFGDGLIFIPLFIAAIYYRYLYGVLVALAVIIQTFFVQIFKKLLFAGAPRPVTWFEGKEELYLIPGVNIHAVNTFPSGHTAAAFCVAFLITVMISQKQWLGLLCFLLAVFAGFSRVYLLQHFWEDVYIGALFGFFSALLAWVIISRWSDQLPPHSKWRQGLIDLVGRK